MRPALLHHAGATGTVQAELDQPRSSMPTESREAAQSPTHPAAVHKRCSPDLHWSGHLACLQPLQPPAQQLVLPRLLLCSERCHLLAQPGYHLPRPSGLHCLLQRMMTHAQSQMQTAVSKPGLVHCWRRHRQCWRQWRRVLSLAREPPRTTWSRHHHRSSPPSSCASSLQGQSFGGSGSPKPGEHGLLSVFYHASICSNIIETIPRLRRPRIVTEHTAVLLTRGALKVNAIAEFNDSCRSLCARKMKGLDAAPPARCRHLVRQYARLTPPASLIGCSSGACRTPQGNSGPDSAFALAFVLYHSRRDVVANRKSGDLDGRHCYVALMQHVALRRAGATFRAPPGRPINERIMNKEVHGCRVLVTSAPADAGLHATKAESALTLHPVASFGP